MGKLIKVAFVDFEPGFVPEKSLLYRILLQNYQVELSKEPEYLIYSNYGERHTRYDCVRIFYTRENVTPDFNFCDYAIGNDGVATKDATYRYIAIGHFGYLAEQQHGELRFNIDGTSQANFDRGTVAIGMSTDYSLTELSGKVNGGNGTPQAFALIKLTEASSSNI